MHTSNTSTSLSYARPQASTSSCFTPRRCLSRRASRRKTVTWRPVSLACCNSCSPLEPLYLWTKLAERYVVFVANLITLLFISLIFNFNECVTHRQMLLLVAGFGMGVSCFMMSYCYYQQGSSAQATGRLLLIFSLACVLVYRLVSIVMTLSLRINKYTAYHKRHLTAPLTTTTTISTPSHSSSPH